MIREVQAQEFFTAENLKSLFARKKRKFCACVNKNWA